MYINKEEISQISNPRKYTNIHLKELEKQQSKTEVSRRKKIINITVEINETKNRKIIDKKE